MTGVTHIVLAMKPLEGNFTENALKYGVSGLNIDGCRVESELQENRVRHGGGSSDIFPEQGNKPNYPSGRFPANVIHDGSDEVIKAFPETAPSTAAARGLQHSGRHGGLAEVGGNVKEGTNTVRGHNDTGGSAARFFFEVKEFQEQVV